MLHHTPVLIRGHISIFNIFSLYLPKNNYFIMARAKKEKADEPKPEKLAKPKAIGPFDVIKMMFTDNDSYSKMTGLLLNKHSFMVNRVFAVQYPMQAHCFNRIGVSGADVVNSWCLFGRMKHGYGRVPFFVYTKSGAKTSSDPTAPAFDKDDIAAYCAHFGMDLKDYRDLLEFDRDFLVGDVSRYLDINSADSQKAMFTTEKNKKRKN